MTGSWLVTLKRMPAATSTFAIGTGAGRLSRLITRSRSNEVGTIPVRGEVRADALTDGRGCAADQVAGAAGRFAT